MGRTVKERNTPHPAPVQKIELSGKNAKIRFFAAVFFLVIGVFILVYQFVKFLAPGKGFTLVSAYASESGDCSGEFEFQYQFGADGRSASAEQKAVRALYTEAAQKAFRLFHTHEAFEGVANVYEINRHPNEEMEVDEVLYNAFLQCQEKNSRYLYLAPIYVRYDDLFFCTDDSGLVDFDPRMSEAVRAEYAAVAAFANDAASVDLKLLGDNRVMLYVSEEYLAFAKEEQIRDFIGFSWMKNAFIADYIADVMIANGYTSGILSSYDGFTRILDDSGRDFPYQIFDRQQDKVYRAAVLHCGSATALVYLRDYPMNSMDRQHYYQLENGEIRTPYLDMSDGLCRSALDNLVSYSRTKGCAGVLLEIAPLYIAEEFDAERLSALGGRGIDSVYCKDFVLFCTESGAELDELFEEGGVRYIR